jgi:hypothetical protein
MEADLETRIRWLERASGRLARGADKLQELIGLTHQEIQIFHNQLPVAAVPAPTTGSIKFTINACSLSTVQPLPGATITATQAGVVVQTINTDGLGIADFTGLACVSTIFAVNPNTVRLAAPANYTHTITADSGGISTNAPRSGDGLRLHHVLRVADQDDAHINRRSRHAYGALDEQRRRRHHRMGWMLLAFHHRRDDGPRLFPPGDGDDRRRFQDHFRRQRDHQLAGLRHGHMPSDEWDLSASASRRIHERMQYRRNGNNAVEPHLRTFQRNLDDAFQSTRNHLYHGLRITCVSADSARGPGTIDYPACRS